MHIRDPRVNSNGHVDLLVEIKCCKSGRQKRLMEAKIEDGFAYHVKGLEQLVHRYLTGRERAGWLLLYVTTPKIENCLQARRLKFDAERPCKQTKPCFDQKLRWGFASEHIHPSGTRCKVVHAACNLYTENRRST